ncbi:MAG: methylenetetrahydrofolate reductase [NAD(P)H] [Planctomycetota bacterium]
MHISDIFDRRTTSFSFEFFPPKAESSSETLFRTIADLEPMHPSFVSVTYGAGGSTRQLTQDLVLRLKRETSLDPVPHLTCVCHSRGEIESLLGRYCEAGISNILALRGDPPHDRPDHRHEDDEISYASDLVSLIRSFGDRHHPDRRGFGIGVAGFPEGHPACPNRVRDIDYLKAKVDAGADYICTQLFFDNRDFYDFVERCRLAGIGVPIIAGIMPVTSHKGMLRMADLALGARFPAGLLRAIDRTDYSNEAVANVGTHWASEQCRDLLDNGVDGIHFYTLNRSNATRRIFSSLGVDCASSLDGSAVTRDLTSTSGPAA